MYNVHIVYLYTFIFFTYYFLFLELVSEFKIFLNNIFIIIIFNKKNIEINTRILNNI